MKSIAMIETMGYSITLVLFILCVANMILNNIDLMFIFGVSASLMSVVTTVLVSIVYTIADIRQYNSRHKDQ